MRYSAIRKIFEGLLLGMTLQFAIGPVCLYLINVSMHDSFYSTFLGVIGATIADFIFISLGIIGISKLINERNIKYLKILGTIILLAIGLLTILSVANRSSFESTINSFYKGENVFWYTLILTLSSPLSIIFWSGIFSLKIIEKKYKHFELFCFAVGCLVATFIFLTVLVFVCSYFKFYFPQFVIKLLNIIVGIIIIFFGFKLFFTKSSKLSTDFNH